MFLFWPIVFIVGALVSMVVGYIGGGGHSFAPLGRLLYFVFCVCFVVSLFVGPTKRRSS